MNNPALMELAACPFCGGEPYEDVVAPHTHKVATFMPDYEGGAMIACGKCHVAIWREGADGLANAIAAWNTRTQLRTAAAEGGVVPAALPDWYVQRLDIREAVAQEVRLFVADTSEDYCAHCLSQPGGPLICCDGYMTDGKLISKHAAVIERILRVFGQFTPTDSGAGWDGVRKLNYNVLFNAIAAAVNCERKDHAFGISVQAFLDYVKSNGSDSPLTDLEEAADAGRYRWIVHAWSTPYPLSVEMAAVLESFTNGDKAKIDAAIDTAIAGAAGES